jgi:aconitate hydratase
MSDLPDCRIALAGAPGGYSIASLPVLSRRFPNVRRLPRALRVVLEAVLRHCDGRLVTDEHVRQLAQWRPGAERLHEIPFVVARVVLQDFTGVPLLADLAAMRDAAAAQGHDPARIEPQVPVDLVVDHSITVDHYGRADSLDLNMKLEFQRNRERYEFMKWGMSAFRTFRVVPPGTGIVHQVNLEYLARGVVVRDGVVFPDTLVGTDSHTTMINGIGVVGWGVGGIEAEAAMLGQPVYLLTPDVVGVELRGRLRPGVTSTDLVLTLTQMLRQARVVGKFVEFFGEGTTSLSVPDRATIANMAPEYGATMGYFPVDEKTVAYLEATGRSAEEVALFEAYYRAQELFGAPAAGEIDYSQVVALDLASVAPSLAGPKRPQDRIEIGDVRDEFMRLFSAPVDAGGFGRPAAALDRRVPLASGADIGSGDVLIAAITSCTNTSNPERHARRRPAGQEGGRARAEGQSRMSRPRWRPARGLSPTTWNAPACCRRCRRSASMSPATAAPPASATPATSRRKSMRRSTGNNLVCAAVLSGNRNFEARIHPNLRANFLASPPLVVAYALAGTVRKDLMTEPLGEGTRCREDRLQFLRRPARASRSHAAGHVRQRPAEEPDVAAETRRRTRGGGLDPVPAFRRAHGDLRCGRSLPGGRRAADCLRRRGVRHRVVA